MTHTPPTRRDCSPAEVIAHALDDHWLTTPPGEPVWHSQAAHHVLVCLHDHGYSIQAAPRPSAPSLSANVATTLITLITGAVVVVTLIRGEWGWAAAGTLAVAFLCHEAARDIRARQDRTP